MNEWQNTRQLKYMMEIVTWPGGTLPAFPTVIVSQAAPIEEIFRRGLIPPISQIRVGGGQNDPEKGEQSDLLEIGLQVILAASIVGDGLGEFMVIGGQRDPAAPSFGQLTSDGRGYLELAQPMFRAIKLANEIDGVLIRATGRGPGDSNEDPKKFLGWRPYNFMLKCAAEELFYHPPQGLAATPSGGDAVLTWETLTNRWDLFEIVLIRKSGTSPPASITDGTEVFAEKTPFSTGTTDTTVPGSGAFSYGLFATYDEVNNFRATPAIGQRQRISDPATVTVTIP